MFIRTFRTTQNCSATAYFKNPVLTMFRRFHVMVNMRVMPSHFFCVVFFSSCKLKTFVPQLERNEKKPRSDEKGKEDRFVDGMERLWLPRDGWQSFVTTALPRRGWQRHNHSQSSPFSAPPPLIWIFDRKASFILVPLGTGTSTSSPVHLNNRGLRLNQVLECHQGRSQKFNLLLRGTGVKYF